MPNLCQIPEQQNSSEQLTRLAAASDFYGKAKLVAGIQFTLTVPAAILSAYVAAKRPDVRVWTTFYSLTAALVDVLVLDRIQTHYRKLGARTQELFDCDLFSLDWHNLRASAKPDTEDVALAARRWGKSEARLAKLRDWYPVEVSQLPLSLARLVCQRASCWWDARLRRSFAYGVLAVLTITIIAVIGISIRGHITVEQMILNVYAPIAPAVLWSVREFFRQRDAWISLDKLKDHIERAWGDALQVRLVEGELDEGSRRIQDAIFDGRSRNPFIYNWVYLVTRRRQEAGMTIKAQELVAEAAKSRAMQMGG